VDYADKKRENLRLSVKSADSQPSRLSDQNKNAAFCRKPPRSICEVSQWVDNGGWQWEIPTVKTLTTDAHKRIRIPDAQPQQVFAYENMGDGRRILTEIKAESAEPFPPGSLRKYVTPERDAEMLELLKGCSLELPK
jgi:hypothetical protein